MVNSSVAICTGRVEAKAQSTALENRPLPLQSARGVWRQRSCALQKWLRTELQSARGVWRQSCFVACFSSPKTSLQSARGVWRQRVCMSSGSSFTFVAICTGRVEAKFRRAFCWSARLRLQSARGVWRQRCTSISSVLLINRCNLHGACGGKGLNPNCSRSALSCNLHGACGGKVSGEDIHFVNLLVAICTGRVEDLASSPEKNPRKFMQTYCIFIHLGV